MLYSWCQVTWDTVSIPQASFHYVQHCTFSAPIYIFQGLYEFMKNLATKSKGSKYGLTSKKPGTPRGHRQFFCQAFKEVTVVYEYYKLQQALLCFLKFDS